MSYLPPCIFFINGDISYPATPPPNPPNLDVFIGSQPNNPTSYITSPSELTTLQIQLFIDDTITKQEFDARVAADPNYTTIIHLRGLRVLVILPSFHDLVNRELADVVMFLHQGLVDIETNRFQWPHYYRIADGPPGQTYDLQRINIYSLLKGSESHAVAFLPFETMPHCESCEFPMYCDRCHLFNGMKICNKCNDYCKCGCGLITNQGLKISPIYAPNCENEANNEVFKHRK